jgi:hypothetical protein
MIRAAAIAIASCLLVPAAPRAPSRAACDAIVAAVTTPRPADFAEQARVVHSLSLEADSTCVADLEQAFRSTRDRRLQPQIADALAALGGPSAVAALRRLRAMQSAEPIELALIAAVGNTRTAEDVAFLVEAGPPSCTCTAAETAAGAATFRRSECRRAGG